MSRLSSILLLFMSVALGGLGIFIIKAEMSAARANSNESASTRLVPAPGTNIDLGRVSKDAPLLIDVSLRNTGDRQITLLEVQPDCGCTTVDIATPRVISGQSLLPLKFEWVPSDSPSKQKRNVLIRYLEEEEVRIGFLTFHCDVIDAPCD